MAHSVIDISGKWQFKEYPISARRMRDLDDGQWFDCLCPNSIFTNLIQAEQIDQRDLLANPENYSCLSDKPWIYRRVFDVTEQLLESNKIELVCDGLDTIANVWLNEKLLGKTDNMFIPHRFDVSSYLKQKNNTLLIKFDPVVPHAKKLMERYTPFREEDFPHPYRSYVRKAQFQFGWDFCPSLCGCGIWRAVRLEGIKHARISNVQIRTINCTEKNADIRLAVEIDSIANKKVLCRAEIFNTDDKSIASMEFVPHKGSGSAVLSIENPKLWWPNGYGEQNLYRAQVELLVDGVLIDRKTNTFGIRTLNLNQSAGKTGSSFKFEINSTAVYAKGANWLPVSIFAGSATEEDYRQLLTAAADANINMLRVWGGGYYEDDLFYQLCDELGIMVWQDFMFACAYYPDRGWFLKQISDEATSIVQRLNNHPCLVLYCGNNEIHWLFGDRKKGKGRKFHGKTIFDKLLPRLMTELDPGRPYIHTTPFSIKGSPNAPDSGTIHNWDVWSGHKPVRDYITAPAQIPRFVTEFGTQSLPSIQTLKTFCSAEKMRYESLNIEKHNYQLDGNSRLYRYTADIFGQTDDLEKFIHLSQLAQGRAAKIYVEYLRANNNRNCGVLFWQFNEVFPAITWSAIDYKKNPKALYYYAKRFFSPLLITVIAQYKKPPHFGISQLKSLSAAVINDTAEPVTGRVVYELTDFKANKIDSMQLPVSIAPFSVFHTARLPKDMIFPAEPEKLILKAAFETEKETVHNMFCYLPDKHIQFPKANIQKQLSCNENNRAVLTLTSDVIAKDVFIEAPDGSRLSDNYIDLLPNEPRQIELKYNCSVDKLQQQIKAYSVLA